MTSNRTLPPATLRRFALALLFVLPLVAGCGGKKTDATATDADATAATAPMEQLYNNGMDALNDKRYTSAADQFSAIEQNYPVFHLGDERPVDAGLYRSICRITTPTRSARWTSFIQLHPTHRDIAYAYYLRALCYYEQIADIQRDQKGTQEAMNALQEVVNRFPDNDLCPRRTAEDRPLPRPSCRQGDGDRPLVSEAASL